MGKQNKKQNERESQRQLMARKRAAAREIDIPAIANRYRREKCRMNLELFIQTYLMTQPDPEKYPNKKGLCYLPMSQVHRDGIRELQDKILYSGSKALAWPRGYGKDSISIAAAIWTAFYGHCQFTLFASYKIEEAQGRIEEIKLQIETNTHLRADFPEICYCAMALERAPQRAKLQTYKGQFTRIEWGTDFIAMPSVRKNKSGGCIIGTASLQGSVRGMRINGVRPKFVILSDPQTRDVAMNDESIEKTMRNIRADFGGLGGPDETLSMLGLVTIIRKGDVADQLTDPKLNPQWNGDRRKTVDAWPERMDLWEKYFEMKSEGATSGDIHGRRAHQFYLKHRVQMDQGSKLAWAEAYDKTLTPDGTPLEISSLQHAMNQFWTVGEEAFNAEYQNEPLYEGDREQLSVEAIQNRLSMYDHCIVPSGYEHLLVESIDVRAREIHYVTAAFKADGSVAIIDYDIRPVFAPEGDLRNPRSQVRPALEAAVIEALRRRRDETMIGVTQYRTPDGKPVEIAMHLVDSRWLTDSVLKFTGESGPRWRPTMGHQVRQGYTRYSAPSARRGAVIRDHWHSARNQRGVLIYHVDADHWKKYAQERLIQSINTPGAAMLYGNDPKTHKLYAKHMASEVWNPEFGRFDEKSKWNHFLDCWAGANCAANMMGVGLMRTPPIERQAMSLQDWFKRRKDKSR